MADNRSLEFFLLRYVPSRITDEFVNIGLVLLELSASGRSVIDARFTSNWQRVQALDPNADLDLLHAVAHDISERLTNGNPEEMLQQMDDSFSNTIQLSSRFEYCSNSPKQDIEALVAKYL